MSNPRVVIVHRLTEYQELLARHGTRGQASFFLEGRGRSLSDVATRDDETAAARKAVAASIPTEWRRAEVERAEVSRFVFGPEDIIVVVGQDGLVANVAKYLDGQPVIGVNPGGYAGVLVPHRPAEVAALLNTLAAARIQERCMVTLKADDGQELTALNEIFLGQPTHQSARYRITADGASERQSSSGVIVSTGTGATGWCASLQRVADPELRLPHPTEAELVWFVREAWPSPSTGVTLTSGALAEGEELLITVESDSLIVFGDGIESDRLTLGWGQQASIRIAKATLRTIEPTVR